MGSFVAETQSFPSQGPPNYALSQAKEPSHLWVNNIMPQVVKVTYVLFKWVIKLQIASCKRKALTIESKMYNKITNYLQS
jgi:hypothetical protein